MRHLAFCMILTLLLTACGAAALPTPDVAATSQIFSQTMIAATLTALPTETVAPTITATNTSTPTNTPKPTRKPKPTRTAKPTEGPKFSGCFTPTGGSKDIAPFKIENMTKNRVSVFINGTTKKGEHPISCSYTLSKGAEVLFTIWFGDYTYLVQLNGKTSYSGSFWVNNVDKATMRVTEKGIKLGPFP